MAFSWNSQPPMGSSVYTQVPIGSSGYSQSSMKHSQLPTGASGYSQGYNQSSMSSLGYNQGYTQFPMGSSGLSRFDSSRSSQATVIGARPFVQCRDPIPTRPLSNLTPSVMTQQRPEDLPFRHQGPTQMSRGSSQEPSQLSQSTFQMDQGPSQVSKTV
jgi:hypothetical protein